MVTCRTRFSRGTVFFMIFSSVLEMMRSNTDIDFYGLNVYSHDVVGTETCHGP